MKMPGIVTRFRTSAWRTVEPLSDALLDFIYPPVCLVCGREAESFSPIFCEQCLAGLKPKLADECPRCGAAVGPYTDLSHGCGQCRDEKFSFDRVIRLGIYEGEMRQACLRAKAADGSAMARGLGEILVREKRSLFEQNEFDMVLPIPEHWSRRLLHSHYAAETLSREIARQLHLGWNRGTLIKTRRTPKQATSSITDRRHQQRGSFRVARGRNLSGKSLLLVDDILTTGSTASAAARELKLAGAKRVVMAVIAVSPLRKIV